METPQNYNLEDLSAYLDGELDEAQQEALEARLVVDPQCREDLEDLKRVRRLFQSWEPIVPKPFFMARFQDRLHAEGPVSRPWDLPRFAVAATVVLSVGSFLFAAYQIRQDTEPDTLDSWLTRSMDQEVLEFTNLQESDLSKERTLDIVLTGNIR